MRHNKLVINSNEALLNITRLEVTPKTMKMETANFLKDMKFLTG